MGPDEGWLVKILGRYLPIVSKPVIFNWCINQENSVKEQLDGGIRYLDLRVASKKDDPRGVFVVHGLYGCEIGEPLEEINNWLSAHPDEVVILDFQHFYAFTEALHGTLISRIKRIFGRKMVTLHARLDSLTLAYLNSRGQQVFVVYRNIVAKGHNDLWPSGLWPTPWPNTVSTSNLIAILEEDIKTRNNEQGFVSQCLLTPTTSYIVRHFCGNLQRDLVNKCKQAIFPWIQNNTPGPGGMNIVITDFVNVENFAFSKLVIQRNIELIRNSGTKSIKTYI